MARILIVEDAAEMHAALKLQLAAMRLKDVVTAIDGQEALALLDTDETIKLIICDWHMTPMDGLTFCTALRKRAAYRDRSLPVIFVTADAKVADPEDRQRALDPARSLGIVAILAKPFTLTQLREAVAQAGIAPD